jgi:hypothetical protein
VLLKHTARSVLVRFDEQNLVSSAGLVPVMRLAQLCGLPGLVAERVRIGSSARPVAKGNPGVNPVGKIPAIVAGMLAGADRVAFVDIDDARRRVFGHAKQGARFRVCKVGGYQVRLRNLNPLIATLSTPTAAPVICATRLRGGNAASQRGATGFAVQAIRTAQTAIAAAEGSTAEGAVAAQRVGW